MSKSDFYNTRERLTALFRKLSNEIIRICSKSISLQKIFDGHAKEYALEIKKIKLIYKVLRSDHRKMSKEQHALIIIEMQFQSQISNWKY